MLNHYMVTLFAQFQNMQLHVFYIGYYVVVQSGHISSPRRHVAYFLLNCHLLVWLQCFCSVTTVGTICVQT